MVLHAMPSLACRGLPWVRSVARATDRGSGCFAGAPPGGGVRHGTVVRGGAVEAGLGPCVGQLVARSAAFWVLFRLLCFGGGAGAA